MSTGKRSRRFSPRLSVNRLLMRIRSLSNYNHLYIVCLGQNAPVRAFAEDVGTFCPRHTRRSEHEPLQAQETRPRDDCSSRGRVCRPGDDRHSRQRHGATKKATPRCFHISEWPCIRPGDDRLSRQRHYHRPGGLNGRVRNGNGCGPASMVAGKAAGGRFHPPVAAVLVKSHPSRRRIFAYRSSVDPSTRCRKSHEACG